MLPRTSSVMEMSEFSGICLDGQATLPCWLKVLQIQTEGAQKRREAETELRKIEGELKQKLLDMKG